MGLHGVNSRLAMWTVLNKERIHTEKAERVEPVLDPESQDNLAWLSFLAWLGSIISRNGTFDSALLNF